MDEYAKLMTSIAELLGAIAWPATLLIIVFVFQSELKSALVRATSMLDRVKKATLPGLALELDRVADAEAETGTDKSGKVTPAQLEAATRIAVQTREVSDEALLAELDTLCLEYDSLRRTQPSGSNRTRAMTRVIVKMRALAPSLAAHLETYKGSGSAGSRLAAIAMMQMVPNIVDLDWLRDRFSCEHPFLFYHAALALQNAADSSNNYDYKQRVREAARQALSSVMSFAGPPDRSTVEILEVLISSLAQ